jgi:hypothetical protein
MGHGRGRGRGRGAPFAIFAAMEELVPVEPAGEVGAAQPGGGVGAAAPGEEAPLPPPPPQLAEVMDRQTRLLETLAEGILHHHGGKPNDF